MAGDSLARHILALDRRGALRGGVALAALAAISAPARGEDEVRENPFTLGVASGEPRPDGVVLWTRLTGIAAPVPVTWEVAADERFARILRRGEAVAQAEDGHSLHIELSGLTPSSTWFYRFRARSYVSPTGRTRTAPAPGTEATIRFANAGCQHFEHGHFTAWRHIAETPLDAVFHYGDYIYEYRGLRPEDGGWAARSRIRMHEGGETLTLEDYRARHAQYRADPNLQGAHAAHPFIVSYDDHEVSNDWAGGAPPSAEFALRRTAALKAWWEAMPLPRAMLEGPAYRRFRFGRHVALHALDTRAHRDAQPCGGRGRCDAITRADAQMLGAAQEAWLSEGLAAARDATWQILAQQVPMMRRVLGNGALSLDKWDGYPAARARLLGAIAERGIGGAVVLSGDVHRALAATLHAEPEDAASAPLATEFTATSVTSEGDGADITGRPVLLDRNPHIAHFGARRGFTLHEAGPRGFSASFRALPYVSRPDAPQAEDARFHVEPGRPGLHRA
ncbi:alkaline phosphatase D family protein [Plastoroseomonas arctica]|uniref:Alkaline phosphatase n=1 Tax=Plastoroseomonas arctica TaxID=1509237 RepID=A0AAF1JV63_9PROT|nr:alkaline phosphatase D family protein [Plastoroseomonas arctica]MBR0654391.1 alkaline phosphatase [Plastoroseomonas arctica]